MLTFSRVDASTSSRIAACIGAAIALTVLTFAQAQADGVVVGGCVGGRGTLNCVGRLGTAADPFIRIVPSSLDAAENERAAERDHRWVGRCRPVVRQDRYGVPRYHYSAPGCEFGVGEYDSGQ